MSHIQSIATELTQHHAAHFAASKIELGELTLDLAPEQLISLAQVLRDEPSFAFNMLIDVCGVDYLHYGLDEWQTQSTTMTGFSRGRQCDALNNDAHLSARFAVVYHLLSLEHNHRIRLRVNIIEKAALMVPSIVDIWPAANWFEREVFDLFGIFFKGHPDLRRILTDYGFVGHPFRKDFPLIGHVEARYDAALGRVIYEKVSIAPRILEPKVIRRDNRYEIAEKKGNNLP